MYASEASTQQCYRRRLLVTGWQCTRELRASTLGTSSERAFGMALALGDLDKEGESSLADSYLYRFGQFALDSRKRTRSRADSPVSLTPKTFDVLLFLAQNPNRLVSKEELLQAVWGDTFVEEGNLTQYISHLRKALGDNSEDTRLIVTIARKGYQFTARVTVAEAAAVAKPAAVHVPGITALAAAFPQSAARTCKRRPPK